MSHRLGSVLAASPAVVLGPAASTTTFSPPAAPGGTKFLMLHFTGSTLSSAAEIRVDLGYGTDVFTAADGPDFWSRPIAGNSVVVHFVPNGGGGQATLSEYGRGEGLAGGGATNTNADLFLLTSPYTGPSYFNSYGVCPNEASPSWENVEVLPPGVMREAARSCGMFVLVHDGHLSSCSAALVDNDVILTAGHCVSTDADARTGAFTLDYQTTATGDRPTPYNPRFYKLRRVVKTGFARPPGDTRPTLDYSMVQVDTPPGGFGVAPLPIRPGLPSTGEELFVIHHPRGAVKKVSRRPTDPTCQVLGTTSGVVTYACDSDNGSSGSPVIDLMGRIVAVNNWAPAACGNEGAASAAILQDFFTEPPPARPVDVVLVLDRSGSMSMSSGTGAGITKIEEARRAAALFVSLLRVGAGHRAGVVSFSTTASLHADLDNHTPGRRNTLVGPPPHNSGIVGGLMPGGMTTIGGGLRTAQQRFPTPGPATNTPAILLMTDGLENTPPMIATVEPELGSTVLNVVGFGTPAALDGPRLTELARRHRGLYTRAGSGLELKKYFVLAFGNIFEAGISTDPARVLAAGQVASDPIDVAVCGEQTITVVAGWDRPGAGLSVSVRTPNGLVVDEATVGVESSRGDTWHFLRVPLPIGGEQDGTWQVVVSRAGGQGGGNPDLTAVRAAEPADRLPEEPFFVAVVADGGPWLRPEPLAAPLYTGDPYNPLVRLLRGDGAILPATMTVEVASPGRGAGNALMETKPQPGHDVDGEPVSGRTATLLGLEAQGVDLDARTTATYTLYDDGEHGDGADMPDGLFGFPLPDLTKVEGDYMFHARAQYGEGCVGTREAIWSVHVDVGIDPNGTTVSVDDRGRLPDGRRVVDVRFTPRDRYGNHLGPGRPDAFEVTGAPGCEPSGGLVDNGDGSYTQVVVWDRGAGPAPGVVVTQPGRPPVVVGPRRPGWTGPGGGLAGCLPWVLVAVLAVLVVTLLVLLALS